ncbi:MAG: acyl--CoA ligase [Acidobacteria bacterium]|nr:acyl--CoA ligase [Acidobacteriota bacterium]
MSLRPRPSLHYPDWPLHRFLQEAADLCPERTALLFDDEQYTYRELDAVGSAFANALSAAGVVTPARVLLSAANRPEWVMAQHGASLAGAATVLGNSSWRSAEISHAISLTQPAAVVADAATAAVIEASGAALPDVRVCLDDDRPAGWESFWQLVRTQSGRRPPALTGNFGTMEGLLPFSSGTTGLPKVVRHTHRSLVTATVQRLHAYAMSDADRLQYFMPLFTIYGVIILANAFGARAPLRLFRRFDAEAVLANMEAERITIGFGSAPVAVALREQDLERYDLSSVRYLLWGATPILVDVATDFTRRTGVPWLSAYGTTEVGIASNPANRPPSEWRLDSPGLPLADVEIRIVALDTADDVGPGEEGEVVVRSPAVMAGYLPVSDDEHAFLPGGWFRTGDVGWMEPEGWLHLTDRAKEMIKVNAFAVAPAEIEAVLFTHPAVADCAVYGITDPRRGEVPKAAVVPTAPGAVTEDELRAHVAERLATYKHLAKVAFVEAIPRNAGGKVLRRVLRDADPDASAPVVPR